MRALVKSGDDIARNHDCKFLETLESSIGGLRYHPASTATIFAQLDARTRLTPCVDDGNRHRRARRRTPHDLDAGRPRVHIADAPAGAGLRATHLAVARASSLGKRLSNEIPMRSLTPGGIQH